MTMAYLVQHGEKERLPGDPGLTQAGRESYDAFLARWARTTDDRDLVPAGGESSRQAGARLLAFLADLGAPGPVAAVTHGGVTIELLRTLLGDDALPEDLRSAGVPPCAITTVDGLHVVTIASRPLEDV